MTPTLTIIYTYFTYNLLLLATASIIGIACVIALHHRTRANQTFSAFTLLMYSVALGITSIITLLFILALFGWLTRTVIFTVVALAALCASIYTVMNYHFFKKYINHPYQDNFNNTLYYVSVGGVILIALYSVLTNIHPTGISDGTSYHLPYAQHYLDHNGLATNINLRFPYHSHNANLLYSFGLTYADSIYCQTLHGLFGVLTALVVFALTMAAGVTAPLAMLASASFLSMNIFRNLSQGADVDLFAGYFVAISMYGICMWRKNLSDQVAFIISAICLGMAMGTKYLEALHALPIAIFIVYQCRALRPLFIYASITALFGLWWYIRSLLITGNPVHPFASEIFGYSIWNEADVAKQMRDLSGFMEKSVINFATLPRLFNEGQFAFTGMQNWMYGFYLAPLFWTRLSSCSKALMLVIWPFLAFWFFTSQNWRYIMPLAPLMIVVCFDMLQIIFNQLTILLCKFKPNLSLASLQPIITGLIIAFILHKLSPLMHDVARASKRALTPVAQDIYLRRYNKEYELVSVANRHFEKGQNVYLFSFYDKTYFLKANAFGDHFGPYRIEDFSPDKIAFASLKEKFTAMHFDGFIMDNNIPYDQALFDREFQRLYHNSEGAVYRIKH